MEVMRGSYVLVDQELVEKNQVSYVLSPVNVYEVIRIIQGVPLFLEEHLERMSASLTLLGFTLTTPVEVLKENLSRLIAKNAFQEGNIKILLNHQEQLTTYAFFIPHRYPEASYYEEGIVTKTLPLERTNPNAKVIRTAYKEQVSRFIHEEAIYEALLVNQEGQITEGSKSNVFFIQQETLWTPPLKDVLGGVTRKRILAIAKELRIPVMEAPIFLATLKAMDAAFISGTSPKILPIKSIDGWQKDSPHDPMVRQLMDAYDQKIASYIQEQLSS